MLSHRRITRRSRSGLLATIALALIGCDRRSPPRPPAPQASTSTTTAASIAATQPAGPIIPDAESWSRDEALRRLAAAPQRASDAPAIVSAALRVLRLCGSPASCAPDPLPPAIALRLRAVRLDESLWALGHADGDAAMRLRCPVLLDATGAVRSPLEGVEEETAVLHVAEDADVFPHLLITPTRVLTIGQTVETALLTRPLPGLRFDLRAERGYPYLALLYRAAAPSAPPGMPPAPASAPVTLPASAPVSSAPSSLPSGPTTPSRAPPTSLSTSTSATAPAAAETDVQVAQYRWDPYERMFFGPACDALPDPPGGTFELDIAASPLLQPVGGRIPAPPPIRPVPAPPATRTIDEPPPY
jgi:hypothetical protein